MFKTDLLVVENERIARHIYQLVLYGTIARKIQTPGQFVTIRCGDGRDMPLRRPLSIASWNPDEETLTLIYRVEGKGMRWLAGRRPEERIDVFGPLGSGFPVTGKAGKRVLLVGGGVGVPPLYGLAQALFARGAILDIHLGFTSRADVFLVEAFETIGVTKVATNDGTLGHAGLVTDLLRGERRWDAFYACGPVPMLHALQKLFSEKGIEGHVSLEQRMGCGIGACLACVYPTRWSGEHVKVCCDGPVFPFEEVML